jgi:hypothetical protein
VTSDAACSASLLSLFAETNDRGRLARMETLAT